MYSGSTKQQWKIVVKNLGLVGNVIRDRFLWMVNRGGAMDYDDIYQEGILGLFIAVRKYDKSLGYKLSTYSYAWISQSIRRAFQTQGFKCIHIPHRYHERMYALSKRFKHKTIDDLFRDKLISKVEYYGMKSLLADSSTLGLDKLVLKYGTRSMNYKDFASRRDDLRIIEELQKEDISILVHKVCERLSRQMKKGKRAKDIIYRRYGILKYDEQTLDEIGKAHSMTKEGVRLIEQKFMKKLKGQYEQYFKDKLK